MPGELRAKYRYRFMEIYEFDDGVFVETYNEPYDVEYKEGEIQIWRNKDGKIVAIDVTYRDG